MSKHTPGPWTYRIAWSKGEPTGYVIHAGAINLADILSVGGSDKEGFANASLIAAAPELLEALERIAKFKFEDSVIGRTIYEICNKAIQKAEVL